ncbi:hypothetical protein DSM106972_087330 [Dulcicalothrix desertica PCC 7102]|uniref:Uncharacterized protein n=1 Tax=Dulcicalothrix desertica PCC 7102 TaxID=232991 RepID=A0A3S1A9S8_9CYAN|nr:hypothetical protein [Dulcicalothrix desertica]RUS96546.1 hypothetical protein DSM106972_087330 [Dulcicalothrix desertica PCC 7102]TWH51388.1 hypothetical protein CAL7102_05798 [Dulcicalothrix desertica PCC 7102]
MSSEYVPVALKQLVFERARGLCEYCRSQAKYFIWNEDTTQMLGITPTGRATVTLFQTNREGVVNMRRVLVIMNQHPPD